MKPGVYPGVPFGEYRAWKAICSSDLKSFRQGPPSLVKYRRDNQTEETDATRLGTACHAALLEGDSFGDRYSFKPDGLSFATKEGKEWRASQAGRTILTFKEAALVQGIVAAVLAKPAAAASLAKSIHREASVGWQNDDGVTMKARPDWYDDEAVVDLKVSRFATERTIAFRAWCEGWENQLAVYREALNANGWNGRRGRLVVVHPSPPHDVFLVEPKIAVLDELAIFNRRDAKRIAEYEAAAFWPGTPNEWQELDLPASALSESLSFLDAEPENA